MLNVTKSGFNLNPAFAGFATPEAAHASGRHIQARRGSNVALAERLVTASLLCDAVIIVYAMIASFWLRFHTGIHELGVPAEMTLFEYSGYIAFGSLGLIFTLKYFQIYDRQLLLRFRQIVLIVVKAGVIWLAGFLCVALFFKFQPPVSRLYVLIAGFHAIAGLLGWRLAFHKFLRTSEIATQLRQRILVVGWNEEATQLMESFSSDPQSAYSVIGCITSSLSRFDTEPPAEIKSFGQIQDLQRIIHEQMIDIVLLSDVDCVKGEIIGLSNLCEKEMVQFKIIPSYFQILVSGLHLETINSVPVLGVSKLPLDRFTNTLLKRTIDIVGATIGLIFFTPAMIIFGLIVYRESPGPILYRQKRLGRSGALFDILKIRSMRLDAEKENRPGWTTKDDPRRLKIGAFMRKWNIDELPQFWNVLMGDMSLVGPRPERPELIQNFKEEIPHYNARHNVKPGITGWAQIKGLRGDTDLTERINCDLFYLENWNIALDAQIMAMTFLGNKNAC